MRRFVSLRPPAFHGEEVEPPHSCGVSIFPLFPLESGGLCFTSLLVERRILLFHELLFMDHDRTIAYIDIFDD